MMPCIRNNFVRQIKIFFVNNFKWYLWGKFSYQIVQIVMFVEGKVLIFRFVYCGDTLVSV